MRRFFDLVSKEIERLYPKLKKILAIFPENSERYLSTVFNLRWIKNKLLKFNKDLKAKKMQQIEPNLKKFCFMHWGNKK